MSASLDYVSGDSVWARSFSFVWRTMTLVISLQLDLSQFKIYSTAGISGISYG